MQTHRPLVSSSSAAAIVCLAALVSCRQRSTPPAAALVASAKTVAKRAVSARPLASAIPAEPAKVDPDVEIVSDGEQGWPRKHSAVLLEYRSYRRPDRGPYVESFFGIHIDADGTVWRFRYGDGPMPHCEYEQMRDSATRQACLYQDSVLVARLSTELLATVKRAIRELAEAPLEPAPVTDYQAILTLPGAGTRDGKPVTVARCRSIRLTQLQSPEAAIIIDVFRRARLQAWVPPPCRAGERRNESREFAPGIPKWTAP